MENIVYLSELYDLYKNLLTKKQQNYFEDSYFYDFSYGEMSIKYHVSRNAIYHQLKLIEERLNNLEEKLNLYTKKKKINDIINMINDNSIKEELENLF